MRSDVSIKPVLMAALGVGLFSVLDAMMKVISSAYPLAQTTGMRFVAGSLVTTIYFIAVRGERPRLDQLWRAVPRALAALLAGTGFFLAINRLQLIDAITLTFLSPLFISLWGWILLKEPLRPQTLFAIILGLVGVIVIAEGQNSAGSHTFDLLGFAGAICCAAFYAFAMVMTRRQSTRDSLPTLLLLPSLIGSAVAIGPMVMVWQPVPLWHYGLLLCIGVAGAAAQLCLIWAYSRSKVGRLGLMDYTALIWGTFFGYVVFHETPSVSTLTGAALIIGACLPAFFSKPVTA